MMWLPIRKAEQKDILAIAAIYDKLHKLEQQKEITVGWIPGVYPTQDTAYTAWKQGELFVYEEDGTVLAAAIINRKQMDSYAEGAWRYPTKDEEVMVLHTLVVDPDAGGRGIGSRFVSFYEAYAAEQGCTALRMDTNEKNVPARTLYKKLGYWEVGIVPCQFNGIPDVNLVLLEKALTRP